MHSTNSSSCCVQHAMFVLQLNDALQVLSMEAKQLGLLLPSHPLIAAIWSELPHSYGSCAAAVLLCAALQAGLRAVSRWASRHLTMCTTPAGPMQWRG
jgi:hypothetical protein